MLDIFLGEFVGTFLLVLLGNGVVANVLLNKSKGHLGGWIVVSFGWGFAVAVPVYLVGYLSGGHINPAVTFSFVLSGQTPVSLLPLYWCAQMLGGILGGFGVWLTYYLQFGATEDSHFKLLCFSTVPSIKRPVWNLMTELIATTVLILGIYGIIAEHNHLASGFAPYLLGILVTAIGLSLGGPTGYAINPARDIGPRVAYTLLYGSQTADWKYAWIPGFTPLLGSIFGLIIYRILFH